MKTQIAMNWFAAVVATLLIGRSAGAAERYTEQTPKYGQQRPKTNSVERIASLETKTVAAFKKLVSGSANTPSVVVTVNDQDLAAKLGAEDLQAAVTAGDIAADLQQMLRRAGLIVLEAVDPNLRCLQVQVRLSARQITVNEIAGPELRWIPDIQAMVKTSWDSRIVAQAQSFQFLGNDAQALRAFEKIGAQNLVRALGIMLLWDFTHNNMADVPLTAVDALNQKDVELSQTEYQKSTKPIQNATTGAITNKTTTPAKEVESGGGSLLSIKDRDQALQQVIDALKAG